MATFRKRTGPRGDAWRVEVWVNGKRESETFTTKAAARVWASDRESELGKGGAQSTSKTLRDVLSRYSRDISPLHKGKRWEQIRLAKIIRDFEAIDLPLRDLSPDDIVAWRDTRLASETIKSPASIAREMTLLRAALAHATAEWKYLTRTKLDDLRGAKKPPPSPPRTQRVPAAAVAAIVEALGYDEQQPVSGVGQRVALAFLLAIETAMRCGELCGLTAADLELKRRFVRLPKTKNGDAREVPLTLEAVRLFQRVPKARKEATTLLDLTARQVDANYRKARDTTSWTQIHFHDTRAEALTRLSAKVDMLTLARIAGHRDPRSLAIYYRESAEDIAARL